MKPNTESLARVGPPHPVHGFPLWYADGSGLRLELGLDRADPLLPAIGEPPDVPAPAPFVGEFADFPDEAFYFYAEAEMTVGGPDGLARARLILALEAAFGGTGEVADGQQIVFGRIRVRCDDLLPDTAFVVVHPYGETAEIRSDERGRLFWTQDLGGSPGDVARALDGQVAPFLRSVSPPRPGYLGDGVTATAVTGSPFDTNLFRLSGPRVGNVGATAAGPDVNEIETGLFTVQGKIATVSGVRPDRLGYRRDASGVVVDVFATTAPGATVEITGTGVPTTRLPTDDGRAAGRVRCTSLPTTVRLSAVAAAPDPAVLTVERPVPDLVTVTRAVHDAATGTLTVDAVSGDVTDPPVLTLQADGVSDTPLAGGSVSVAVVVPPREVRVVSGHGGTGRRDVELDGPATDPVPVTVVVAGVAPVPPGRHVVLDGTASTGDVTAWAWTAVPDVGLAGADTPTASFTAPGAAGDVAITLTVEGPGGTATATTTVTVTAPAAAVARAGADVDVAVGDTVRLDGSASENAVTFAWSVPDRPGFVLTGADTASPTFPMPAGDTPITLRLIVTGPVGPPAEDTVDVRPLPDRLVVDVAQFRTGKLLWRIGGTATGRAPDRVTASLSGQVIGTALADATGAWDIRRTVASGDPLRPSTSGARIRVESTRGGVADESVIVRN